MTRKSNKNTETNPENIENNRKITQEFQKNPIKTRKIPKNIFNSYLLLLLSLISIDKSVGWLFVCDGGVFHWFDINFDSFFCERVFLRVLNYQEMRWQLDL